MKRSLFRYYGGKWRIAPWIVGFFPQHRTYVEPYCGAGSVFFRKSRCYSECLNDINGDIVNLYKVLQTPKLKKQLIAKLKATPYSREAYDQAHEINSRDSSTERAKKLLIRSLMGYHSDSVMLNNSKSGFRNDLDRKFTIPPHEWVKYPDTLDDFANRLKGVVIENSDASYLFNKWKDKNYLWYIDPPYVQSTRTDANKHSYAVEMNDEDHEKLLDTIQGLSGAVVISGYDSEIYERLEAAGWMKQTKEYNNNTFNAGSRTECLWLNPQCQRELGYLL